MIAWLTDTLIYSGLLIALVLALRGPVARAFGPQAAYALWALPLLRFLMPPIVLPADYAPVEPAGEVLAVYTFPADSVAVSAAPALDVPMAAASAAGWSLSELLAGLVLPLWLAGAAAFLAWRTWTYLSMRERLLVGSRPVGEVGRVRLVEAPAVSAPVAFGVLDKVIALPVEFMAWHDRQARDLAIEHELSHHRGGDLLANILAQPVLALHWFNPLAWIGWRAMRRDQEAACDARVIAYRAPEERAFYGEVIASFAAGPRLALAAPMACPMASRVLGEKSIIHRLRSLNMSEVSPRRRLAGRGLLAGAALAVPFTASISYAEAQVPPPPAPAPMVAPVAPDARNSPEAPEAPHFRWMGDDGDVDVQVTEEDGKRVVTITRELREGEAPRAADSGGRIAARSVVVSPGQVRVAGPMQFQLKRGSMSEAEWEKHAEEMERFGAEMERRSEEYAAQWEKWGEEFAAKQEAARAQHIALAAKNVSFDFACDEDGKPVKIARAEGGDRRVQNFALCNQNAGRQARAALERARASVARDRSLSDDTREEVLKSLERELKRISKEISAVLQPAVRAFSAPPTPPAARVLSAPRVAPAAAIGAQSGTDCGSTDRPASVIV